MSTTIIIVLVIIFVLIVAFYVYSMIRRRQTEGFIIALEERKEELFDLPVQDEFDKVKSMHLVGQSQKVYREWHQKWVDLSQNSFAELENSIFEAEQLNDSFRWGKAKEAALEAESLIKMMETDAEAIRSGLNELMEQERYNSTKIQDALDMYDKLRNHIADNAEHYGSTIGMIEESLSNIETEFNQFVELNSKGDPVEAAEILEIAEEHTIALNNITERIPEIIHLVDDDYEKQLSELEENYKDFTQKNYKFPETFNLEQSIKNVRNRLKETKENLERFELDRAENLLQETKQQINGLYDIFEKEYSGRKNFEKNAPILKPYIEHTRENNRSLLLEIDHALQAYILSDNEKASVRSAQLRLDDLEIEADNILKLKDVQVQEQPYSMINRRVNAVIASLQEIEEQQMQINEQITSLSQDEKKARETAQDLDTRIRMIKRFVEKRNLPGLPTAYLDLFFTVSSQVEKLFKEMDKVRINMETIKHMADLAKEQLERLKTETDKLVDNAALAEQLMQYANRFKLTNANVASAMERSLTLFERDRDYTASFNTISAAIEEVDPGATERIVNVYENTKTVPEYRL
ncbi:MAG: septation ring formation regulator EzrA [Streptococcaceae bacterium]|jgi:septation ring formation regulator|nr:septation ring formation regulator EzrA [Streptococcaceae bacterium]